MKKWNSNLIKKEELARYNGHLTKKYGEEVSRETIQWINQERIHGKNPTADDIEVKARKIYDNGIIRFYRKDIFKKIDRIVLYSILVISIIDFILNRIMK